MPKGVSRHTLGDVAAVRGFGTALFEYDEGEMSHVVVEFCSAVAVEDSLDNSSVVSKLRKDLSSNRLASKVF
ncbi:hypothetical protein GCM10011362_27240 [Marinobacter halophilus]|nr:hypothetical protein GCM10011362_27240 [Marinobacter halophilus]